MYKYGKKKDLKTLGDWIKKSDFRVFATGAKNTIITKTHMTHNFQNYFQESIFRPFQRGA